MTIAAGWVRHFGQSQELVLASDSRLRWAGAWDSCPKLFALPRSDAAIAFAGDTMWAYPIIAQTANHIAAYRPSTRRENDLLEAKGHVLRVINAMIRNGDALSGPEAPDDNAAFLFAGYSASEGAFRLWRFHYSATAGQYTAERIRQRHFGQFCFIGDVAEVAAERLRALLLERGRTDRRLDLEPLEIIRELLRQGTHDTIGGPVQLIKVYRHMNTEPFVVVWRQEPEGQATRTLLGRTLLDYEALDAPVVDVDAPFGPPPPGPGALLQEWDADLLSIMVEEGAVNVESLLAAAIAKELELDRTVVEDWLAYAERRGLVHGQDVKSAVMSRLPWAEGR